MTTFADIGLPVFVIIFSLALAHYLFLLCRMARKAWKRRRWNPCRVSLRSRLRESRRLAWFRLTRRMPRYKGRPGDGSPRIDVDEAIEFGKLAGLYLQRGIWADDPQQDRRLP